MRDFHAAGFDRDAGIEALPEESQDDVPGTDQQGFKRFRRRTALRDAETVAAGPVRIANLPARIEGDWALLPQVSAGFADPARARAPLVNLHRDGPAARAFDLLRTRLLQALRDNGWSRVAVAGPTRGSGATFTAVNLALSLARIPDSRTVLTDLNLRAPGVGAALGLPAAGDMRGFLGGDVPLTRQYVRICDRLALGLARQPEGDASELLQSPAAERALGGMVSSLCPGVALFDLPPVLEYDDLAAFLPHVDGVLLVSDGNSTTAAHIAACERVLKGQARLLGVVLNRARRSAGVSVA